MSNVKDTNIDGEEIIQRMLNSRGFRIELANESFYWFFHFYLRDRLEFPTADFHREMFSLAENDEVPVTAIMAFRGSGKSTIMNLGNTLWAVLGKRKKRFVVIISNTIDQAQGHFSNILLELKNNTHLISDLGPFTVDHASRSLILENFGAKIIAVARSQSIRGMIFGDRRPDLIIIDDIEDTSKIKLEHERNVTYEWFKNEVIPSGDLKTNVVVLGNLLHRDSLLMAIRRDIITGRTKGEFRAYPLIDDSEQILWPGKFPTINEVKKVSDTVSDPSVWDREYLLEYDCNHIDVLKLINNMGSELTHTQKLGRYRISAPCVTYSGLFRQLEENN